MSSTTFPPISLTCVSFTLDKKQEMTAYVHDLIEGKEGSLDARNEAYEIRQSMGARSGLTYATTRFRYHAIAYIIKLIAAKPDIFFFQEFDDLLRREFNMGTIVGGPVVTKLNFS